MSQFAKNGDMAPNGGEIVANGQMKGAQSGVNSGAQPTTESSVGKRDNIDRPEPASFAQQACTSAAGTTVKPLSDQEFEQKMRQFSKRLEEHCT